MYTCILYLAYHFLQAFLEQIARKMIEKREKKLAKNGIHGIKNSKYSIIKGFNLTRAEQSSKTKDAEQCVSF